MMTLGMAVSPFAFATNGMMMEGYGPIATGMGGASMAYDNGAAGMANNPATLGMMADGSSRFDLAVGGMHPNVVSKVAGMPDAKSGGTAYYMPAGGWVKKNGAMSYGVGVFAQGGMGTEYDANSWVSAGTGRKSRSEVGVGNLIIPIAYDVTPDFNIGGSFDYVWAGLDLQMAMTGAQMGNLAAGGNLSATGAGAAAMPAFMGGANNVGYFDFSDGSSFTGKAKATGYAGKIGMTYKVNSQMTIGATYHSKTSLGDLSTGGAKMLMIDNAGAIGPAGTTYTLTGDIKVVNFQWPEVYGVGMAYQANESLMVVADFKRIGWAKVMKNFHMTFTTTDMGGMNMDMKLPQDWKDQDVFSLGVAYRTSESMVVRAGTNQSSNPVPDDKVNPLFPATVKSHYMVGMGYAFSKTSDLNASFTYVPNVSVTAPAAAGGYTIDHSQMNWQLMYSNRF
jgi:long-chain fatty acid transport protein